jgi:DNA-binding transcriptional ArsR family regulator
MNMMTEIPPFEIKNAFKDWRAVYFQDDIRRAMIKAIAPVKETPLPREPREPRAPVVPRTTHSNNCLAILRHLADSEDSRAGLFQATRQPKRTMDRALRDMRDKGQVERIFREGAVIYRITPEGAGAISVPPPASVAGDTDCSKHRASAEKVDAVFALLSAQPATRAAMQRALRVGSTTMEACLRALRAQNLIVWVRCPVSNVKTYSVAVKP